MLDKIVFFLYVVRCGSFSEAARQYGISCSAGSRWIFELEENMGVSLLKRTTRKVVATQAGKKLFERFSDINKEINEVFSEIQNLGQETKGLIKVAATPLFAKYYIGQLIGEFLQQYPKVRFKIFETPFDVDYVEDVDFAIKAEATYRGRQEKNCLLVKRTLFKEPLYTSCSPSYIERFSKPEYPEELKDHNCLFASTLVGGNRWIFAKNGEYTAVEISQTVEVDDSEILRATAVAGGGIAYLPCSLVKKDFDRGALVRVLEDYDCGEFEFGLYFKPRKQMPARCENFKNYLIKRVPEIRAELLSKDAL